MRFLQVLVALCFIALGGVFSALNPQPTLLDFGLFQVPSTMSLPTSSSACLHRHQARESSRRPADVKTVVAGERMAPCHYHPLVCDVNQHGHVGHGTVTHDQETSAIESRRHPVEHADRQVEQPETPPVEHDCTRHPLNMCATGTSSSARLAPPVEHVPQGATCATPLNMCLVVQQHVPLR